MGTLDDVEIRVKEELASVGIFPFFLIMDEIYHESSHKKFNVATTISCIQYPAWYTHMPGFTVVRITH